MKKRSNKSFLASAAYLVVALVLCAGVIFYTGNGGTGLTVADITDTMPETGTDEIVAGEEEVPLASAPKVSVKKSTKTTTKKKTLKKAAKKTKTTTKKKTSKKKSTKKTAIFKAEGNVRSQGDEGHSQAGNGIFRDFRADDGADRFGPLDFSPA